VSYFFHPAAEAEFLELIGYYESKVPGLGGAFDRRVRSRGQVDWRLAESLAG